jgi:transposase InsO family protein
MRQICGYFEISPQAHYQKRLRERERHQETPVILEMVRQVRRRHPRMGVRKLQNRITPMLASEGLRIGRDRLFDLLRQENLLVPPKKAYHPTTAAGRIRAPNRLLGLTVAHRDQVWVCDITYLNLRRSRFAYLFVIMDLYSRYIVGWHVSPSLAVDGAVRALKMALANAPDMPSGLIHHSDHGTQYTSHEYMQELADHKIMPSMGAVGNCYDNAFAERLIGILKDEYLLDVALESVDQFAFAVEEAVDLYNTDRPHYSLSMEVPASVYQEACLKVEIPRVTIPAEQVFMN